MSNSSDFRAAPLSEGDARAEWEEFDASRGAAVRRRLRRLRRDH